MRFPLAERVLALAKNSFRVVAMHSSKTFCGARCAQKKRAPHSPPPMRQRAKRNGTRVRSIQTTSGRRSATVVGIIFPAGFRVVRRYETHRLDLMNLAAVDLKNVCRWKVEWFRIDRRGFKSGNPVELVDVGLHGLPELRQPEHQPGLRIGDHHANRLDARDVVERASLDLRLAAIGAQP